MLLNYFKTALRNLRNNSFYSFINISGLSVCLAISILLLLWVKDELSYDGFHANASKLFKLAPKFDDQNIWNSTPAPIGVYAQKEIPEVENACRIKDYSGISVFEYNGKKFTETRSCLADASFFSMFTFPLIKGNLQQPFGDPGSIVLSETTAKIFFGDEEPIGKVIKGDDNKLYRVTGIMKDMPANSSFRYNIIFNLQQLEQEIDANSNRKSINTNWDLYNYSTFILLREDADPKIAGQKMSTIHRRNYDIPANKNLVYLLNPITKSHLYSIDGKEQRMMTVRVFFIIAVIVLLIACINYVNLVTARAMKRSKEISLRKIVGAGKANLFMQLLGESLLTFFIALIVAIVIMYLVMPLFNDISGKQIVFEPWSPDVLAVCGLTMLATLLLAGIYPAITLSSFKPLDVMKGKINGSGRKGNFRKSLVVIQFSFSIMLITSTIIIGKQLKYIREKNLGYVKENVFSFQMREIKGHYDAAREELLKQPGILGVTASNAEIINNGSGSSDVDWEGKRADQQSLTISEIAIERNFTEVMGMQLVEGIGFTGSPADSANFILNEMAIKATGIKSPVIGKRLTFQGTKGVIAGVIKDFHFQDMHQEIRPLLMHYSKNRIGKMYIRTTGKDAQLAIAATEKIWKKYNVGHPFDYSFLDNQFEELYKSDIHVGQLFNCFAIVAILISCLGLFGLVTFTAENRLKEIGVRKVLGAGTTQIVSLLSKDLLVLVLIAAGVAFPIAWYGLNNFLQGFAYRTSLSWWAYALAGIATMVIAMLTVSIKCLQAAFANPIRSLKGE